MKSVLSHQFAVLSLLLLCCTVTPSGLNAQPTAASEKPADKAQGEALLKPSLSQFTTAARQLVSRRANLFILVAGASATLAVRPFDDDISRDLREEDLSELEVEVPNAIGSFFAVGGAGVATYLVGRFTGNPTVANTGLYLFEAVMATQVVTFITKISVGRTRPDNSNDLSFPSGHTSAMTAIAAVLQQRHGWKFGAPAFALAAYVGVTRIKSQKHFASDVLAGATIGTIVGISFIPHRAGGKAFAVIPIVGPGYAGFHAGVRF